MKLTNLYNELEKKYPNRVSSLNGRYKNNLKESQVEKTTIQEDKIRIGTSKLLGVLNNNIETAVINNDIRLDDIKIIGITGSKGKSTVAYLTHKYLEFIGKKSILYSSIEIDSKASNKIPHHAVESSLANESVLMDIIEEAIAYGTEYIVLEVNETAIANGIVKNVPFTIKALTNIIKDNSFEFKDNEEYVNSKKSFFLKQNEDDNFISFFGMTNPFTREDFNEFLMLSDNEIITYGSKSTCIMQNADYTNIDYLVQDGLYSMDGIEFTLKNKEKSMRIKSSILDLFNAPNIALVVAMLDRLKVFNEDKFKTFIADIQIPGRNELIKVNNRYIVIGINMYPILENFKKCQERQEINDIKVVIGSIGAGFNTWEEKFQHERRVSLLYTGRHTAANYAVKTANYIYITSNDPGASDPLDIANEIKGYIDNRKPSEIIVDRKQAIRQAILDSKAGDVIFIGGRGNRQYFCKSKTECELFTDLEVVQEVIKDLGW